MALVTLLKKLLEQGTVRHIWVCVCTHTPIYAARTSLLWLFSVDPLVVFLLNYINLREVLGIQFPEGIIC